MRAFRARFDALDESPEVDPREDGWFLAALELHGLALWQDFERVRAELPGASTDAVIAEVNLRRLASSPLPPSLAELWRARHERP